MQKQAGLAVRIIALATLILLTGTMDKTNAQQKELPEVTLLTAVPNFAFAAIWVAEQLKYFEQEGVRVKITPAPSGSVCLNAVVGRSTTELPPPDEKGRIPYIATIPSESFAPGRVELRATLRRGPHSSDAIAFFNVTAPEASAPPPAPPH